MPGWRWPGSRPPAAPDGQHVIPAGAGAWKCGAATGLPVDCDVDWDGVEAANSIFDEAGFNDAGPDPAMARRGFLPYDASAPTTRGAYKLPFCVVKNGKLTAMASGLRAAADRLDAKDIPDDVRAAARQIIEGYGIMTQRSSGGSVRKEGRVLSGTNETALRDCHDMAEQGRRGIAAVLGVGFPSAGSAQNPDAPPPPGACIVHRALGPGLPPRRIRCVPCLLPGQPMDRRP